MRIPVTVITPLLLVCLAGRVAGQDTVRLTERFEPGHVSKVDVGVKLTGKLAVPTEKGKSPRLVTLTGNSRVVYDERVLSADAPGCSRPFASTARSSSSASSATRAGRRHPSVGAHA